MYSIDTTSTLVFEFFYHNPIQYGQYHGLPKQKKYENMAHGPGGWWITTVVSSRDLKTGNLVKVVTWGEAHCGGDSSQVQDQLKVGFSGWWF